MKSPPDRPSGGDATGSLWRQSSLVWGGTLIAAAIAFVVQVMLARHLGTTRFGAFSNTYAIASLIGIFGFQGVGEVMMRHPGRIDRSAATKAFLVMFGVGMAIATCWYLFTDLEPGDCSLALAFIPFTLLHIGLLAGMVGAQIRGRSVWIASWPMILQIGRLLPLLVVTLVGSGENSIPIGWAICLLLPCLYGLRQLARSNAPVADDAIPGPETSGGMIRASFPFSATRMLEYAEIQLPVILAMALISPESAAWIAAVLTLVQGLLLLPIAVFQRLLRPRFHRWAESDRTRLVRVAMLGAGAMAIAGTILMLAGRPFAETVLTLIFGSGFAPATDALSSILLLLPIWFASIAVNAALVTSRDVALRSGFQAVGVGVLAMAAFVSRDLESLNGIVAGVGLCQTFLLLSGIVILLTGRRHAPAAR